MLENPARTKTFYYPNTMGRILLLSLEEVLGRNSTNAVLNVSGLHHLMSALPPDNFDLDIPFENLAAINQSLEDMYGPRGGRGVALRAGRATLKYGLRDFGPILRTSDQSFRLLPLHMKLLVGTEFFARAFNDLTDQIVRLEKTPDAFLWHTERCPFCWGRSTRDPCCHFVVGILQEALYWLSGGKTFPVEEIACIGMGNEICTIRIDRQPLD
ncbi:MAG TPA: 4-vinyl reductase [Anaerolineae bacterium]|nr:4-vinyl reductase [Anaerolineae bacterium]